jgi:AbrB family looped-hinge helix DNA binding protein
MLDLRGKPNQTTLPMETGRKAMFTLLVSSRGQIVLPAAIRRRLGIGAGARLEVVEEADGLKLRVIRSVPKADVAGLAGMLKAPARGVPRDLEDFDPATLVARGRPVKS